MTTDSNTDEAIDFSGEATNNIEIHLPEKAVNEMLCLLNVPFPPINEIDKVLIHIKHDLGFRASLDNRDDTLDSTPV